jgi:S-DNA-T family DNA segregation ATPase FtsK/SpoIIIE
MLFYPQGYSKPARLQGAFITDKEVSDVVDFLKGQTPGNAYDYNVEEKIKKIITTGGGKGGGPKDSDEERDELFVDVGWFIIEADKASIGNLQRKFKIGFNRAARIMDQLCGAGVVGDEEGTKARKILMNAEQFARYIDEYM